VIPDIGADIAFGAVVLRAAHEPAHRAEILRDILDFGDCQAVVAMHPVRAAIGRAEKAAVVADIDHIRIDRIEGERVLIGVNRIGPRGGLGADIGPGPPAHGVIAAINVDGAEIDGVGVVRLHRHVPVVPCLTGG
jgi:hypothetical protein